MKSKFLTFIIIAFYIISLFTESYNGSGGILGISTLVFGGLSVISGNLFAFGAWLANILFFLALTKKSNSNTKSIISGIALILAFLSVFITDLPMHMGSSTSSVKIGIGFYFWITSFALLFIKTLFFSQKD